MSIFQGEIQNPSQTLGGYGGLFDSNGPLSLLSNVFQLVAVVGGILAIINLFISGIQYLSSQGNTEAIQQAWRRITLSLIGLIIIVGAYTIAGVIGQLLYGDPGALLNPRLFGAK